MLLSEFKKKLVALSNYWKKCEEIQPWIRSMCNNLYWVPLSQVSSCLKKWEFIVNHVQNIHEHDGQLYTECAHGTLKGRERQKKSLCIIIIKFKENNIYIYIHQPSNLIYIKIINLIQYIKADFVNIIFF